MSTDTRKTGVIRRVVKDRGFGFLRDDKSSTEYFFHRSSVGPNPTAFDSMSEGDSVSFVVGDSPKGPRAEEVTVG